MPIDSYIKEPMVIQNQLQLFYLFIFFIALNAIGRIACKVYYFTLGWKKFLKLRKHIINKFPNIIGIKSHIGVTPISAPICTP